jgi:hypothetical protein
MNMNDYSPQKGINYPPGMDNAVRLRVYGKNLHEGFQ